MNINLFNEDCLLKLDGFEKESIDSIVTDPPYNLNFMSKKWDNTGISFNVEMWKKCYKVLKPGSYLLVFGGTRTYHRIACAIEEAGFEIRDTIMWLYGSGFPKSMNIGLAIDKKNGIEVKSDYIPNKKNNIYGKNMGGGNVNAGHKSQEARNKWNGWGTCLKPAFEPIIVARKPFKGTLINNVVKNGVGGINIDECRVETNGEKIAVAKEFLNKYATDKESYRFKQSKVEMIEQGRFPANVIHDGLIEEWSRYFYCAKASKKDRNEGLDNFEANIVDDGRIASIDNPFLRGETLRKNTHPTVKPIELMQYLVRLVTPSGGIVLDPFMGSGSTGKAVIYENLERNKDYSFIGIEMQEEYYQIANARIEYAKKMLENKECD